MNRSSSSNSNSGPEPRPSVPLRQDRVSYDEYPQQAFQTQMQPDSADPDTATLSSMALSEAQTYIPSDDRNLSLSLPQTYQENFASYAPYALSQRNAENVRNFHEESDADDANTVFSSPEARAVMQRRTSDYNRLRTMVVVSKRIKNDIYVFSDQDSFEAFKKLKSGSRKSRRGSADSAGSSSSAKGPQSPTFGDPDRSSLTSSVESDLLARSAKHSLPLLKIEVPYMSAFRPKTAYMIFRRYEEVKDPESHQSSAQVSGSAVPLELVDFCHVKLKTIQHAKRYTFVFQQPGGQKFKVFAFQHNYRPFTDFSYKDTRFRVFGTSRTVSYPTFYNPELKLQVLDDDQSSLVDGLIEKKAEKDFFRLEKPSQSVPMQSLENPVLSPDNPLIRQVLENEYSSFYRNSVPQESPPFGKFLDARVYQKKNSILPKKYAEIGKIAVYEDCPNPEIPENMTDSAVGLDSLVLSTIFLALRETSIRSTVKRDDVETY